MHKYNFGPAVPFVDCPDCAEDPELTFRHAYRTQDGRKGAYFCPTCHGVFKLVPEGVKE